MRITAFFLLAACLQVSARSHAQTVTLSLKNAALETVFKEIQRQTGYNFVYNNRLLDQAHPVDVQVARAQVDEVLAQCFKDQPLDFSILDKTIIVRQRIAPIPPPSQTLPPPLSIDVKGHIVDENGDPVPGASVIIKGTTRGTTADISGNFLFKEVDPQAILVISATNIEKKEVKVNGNTDISVRVHTKVNNLNEIVVNKGYYTEKQILSTGNVSIVKGEDIAKQPVTDPLLALEGRVPGLFITQTSGVPGSYSTVQLRGQNNLPPSNRVLVNYGTTAINDPLYLIDGVPYSSQSLTSQYIGGGVFNAPIFTNGTGQGISPFNSINTQDIESIEVLKDADATAIYGSRGANGVILITTKKGKAGKTKIDAGITAGGSKITREIAMLNTTQYLQMWHEAFRNDDQPFPSIVTNPYDNYNSLNGIWDTTRYTDWQKVLIGNTASFTNTQLSVSGGNSTTSFLIGGGYSKQGMVFPGNYQDKKVSVNANINHVSENKRLHIQLSTSFSNDNNKAPLADFTSDITLAPDAPALYDAHGNINWEYYLGYSTFNNPVATTNNEAKAISNTLLGNLMTSYQIIPDLQISTSFGYTQSQLDQTDIGRSTALSYPANINPSKRRLQIATDGSKTWIVEPQLTFHHTARNMTVDALLGSTIQGVNSQAIAFAASGFGSDALIPNPALATTKILSGYNTSQYRYNAAFARLGFVWAQKYVLNFTGRRDGSSRFGSSRQFGNFGSVGAAWIFSHEGFFMEKLPWLSLGKLRASYGTTGNDQIGDYQYLSTYSASQLSYQTNPGLSPTALANPDLAWQRTRKIEVGLEFGLAKDRIVGSASYYRNRTDNQLVGYPLPDLTGFNSVEENLNALIQNTGFEFTLNTTNIRSQSFTWNSSFNFSMGRNKLLAFPGIENTGFQYAYAVGKSLSIQYLYHYTGVDPQTGLYTFAAKQGSGLPAYGTDFTVSKPVTQDYFGGLNNTFRYKEFQLDFLVQFVKQLGKSYLGAIPYSPGRQYDYNYPTEILDHWRQPGDKNSVQRISTFFQTQSSFNYFKGSDGIITDASFVRFKSVSLSYQFSDRLLKQISLQNASFYIQCQNLFTITNYKGLDPETQGLGLPPLRTITAGLHITL